MLPPECTADDLRIDSKDEREHDRDDDAGYDRPPQMRVDGEKDAPPAN
jgi:hypothetical protein